MRRKKPKLVIPAMLYHLDENQDAESWAAQTIKALGYDREPRILQGFVEAMYEYGTKHIRIDGVERVSPLPLFEVLDGKDTNDYKHRVEPSVEGGRKMGKAIVMRILDGLKQ